MFKTIKQNVTEEIVEKRSKFIANIVYVQTVEEAEECINNIKKKHFDAKHHCYAYSIMSSEGIINRASDDGEPNGTAGLPILNIINKNELINVLVVVTRYFGGILLGTGGLVRAYSGSTLKAINKAEFVIEERGYEIQIEINYNDFEKLNYYCKNNNINIIKVEYLEKIMCKLEMNRKEKDKLLANIRELNFKIENYKVIKEKNIRKNIEN